MTDEPDSRDNRDRKVEGRAKRRRHVQGTRAFTHAMTNSMARRAAGKRRRPAEGTNPDPGDRDEPDPRP